MIIVEVIGWIIVVWLTYSIISVGIHIIKQGGKDARDMIGCFALPVGLFLIAIVVSMCNNNDEKKETKPINEKPVVSTVAKPKKERKKEPHELRDGYNSTEGFKFGISYDEAKRIVEKEVGEVWHEREENLYRGDKHFSVSFINTIDSLDISGIEFYFQNDELYGIKAETWFPEDAEHHLTEKLGKPYNMDGKRIWIVNKGNGLYYLSLYNEMIYADIVDDELDISEQDVIEYIRIK